MANWQANKEARRSAYAEKLKDPRWQKLRLEVLQRDGWKCRRCENDKETLHVHHLIYEQGKEPWDAPLDDLLTLCESCHEYETAQRFKSDTYLLRCVHRSGFSPFGTASLGLAFTHLRGLAIPDFVASLLEVALRDKQFLIDLLEEYTPVLKREEEEMAADQAEGEDE